MKHSLVYCILMLNVVSLNLKFAFSILREDFFPFGSPNGDNKLPNQDEISTAELKLNVPIVFYGELYKSLFVNSNGLVSFLTEIPYFFNNQFPLDYPIIAPFYSDVDLSGTGNVYYRETNDRFILNRVTSSIRDHFSDATDYKPTSVFVVTWDKVGPYKAKRNKVNTYQVVMVTDGKESYVVLSYAEDGLQWLQSDGKTSGLDDALGQAGFVSADGRLYKLKGSGTDQVRNLDKWSNVNIPGVWMFRVGQLGSKYEEVKVPDKDAASTNAYIQGQESSCVVGGTVCHSSAICNDFADGFCCQCNKEFYGNGINCLNKEKPIRVTGKVNGEINGVKLQGMDLHSYVLSAEGRTYTAVSQIPINLGYDIQSLTAIAEGITWLFAIPKQGVPNGFDLTGGHLNRTVEINFPQTGHKVIVKQMFKGLDVFNNVVVDTELTGSLPTISFGSELEIDAFKEEFTKVKPGQLRAHSSRAFKLKGQSIETPFAVETYINYNECTYSPPNTDLNALRLKVDENIFIRFDQVEKIVRFSFTAKVGTLEEEDPCIKGKEECGANSQCIVDGDNFRCVCEQGYEYIYDNARGTPVCLDVNECVIGSTLCDKNAFCINTPGSYRCVCKNGFTGNGHYCSAQFSCETAECDLNASCKVTNSRPECQCNRGFKGDGLTCVPDFGQDGCDVNQNCSPYAVCIPSSVGYRCQCLQGYIGNGYLCEVDPVQLSTEGLQIGQDGSSLDANETLRPYDPFQTSTDNIDKLPEVMSPECILDVCWCRQEYEYETESSRCLLKPGRMRPRPDSKLNPSPVCTTDDKCTCPPDYLFNPLYRRCDSVAEALPCHVINNCHSNAQCFGPGQDGMSQCVCNAGYTGNGYACSLLELSCDKVDICNVNAVCIYDDVQLKSVCMCKEGFLGDGIVCSPRDDCNVPSDCDSNAQCTYNSIEQRYTCICNENFKGDGFYCSPLKKESCITLNNCGENSDCVYQAKTKEHECRCHEGFKHDGQSCQRIQVSCNVINNCGANAQCVYEQTIGGYECKCWDGYSGDGFYCKPVQSCFNDPSVCHQDAICQRSPTNELDHNCVCIPGFNGDGYQCRKTPDHDKNFLLISQGLSLLRMPIDSNLGRGFPIHIDPFMTAVGADIDCQNGVFYWTDVGTRTIRSSDYDGQNKNPIIKQGQIGSPEDVAVDWVSMNIFWTDSVNDVVSASHITGARIKTLIKGELVNPRGITVHPGLGFLFWSDWNRDNPKIERSGMDGSGREVLVSGQDLSLPNSLVVDFENSNLCWADAGTHKIECIGIQGYGRRVIIQDLHYPFGLTLHKNSFYFTDWNDKRIHEVDKYSGAEEESRSPPPGGSGRLYGIVAVPDQCPPVSNVCQSDNGGCPGTHLCLPNGRGGRTCVCPDKSSEKDCWDSQY